MPSQDVRETPAGTLELQSTETLVPLQDQGNYIYLQQDLVDRQIIDIHGRKVVRVNDVDLEWMGDGAAAPVARGRSGSGAARGVSAGVQRDCCPERRLKRCRAGSKSAAFPGSLSM